MPLYWLCYRHNNQASLVHARMHSAPHIVDAPNHQGSAHQPPTLELIQLLALALLSASLPPVDAGNASRRQWLSYFGISTVNGYHRMVFARPIDRDGCGYQRSSTNDNPKH